MSRRRLLIALVVPSLTVFLPSLAAAQASRTWVSGVGDDANPCSRSAPCKTFAGAISKTAAGGEIDVLDPGGFGAVTITKSIVIDATGSFGSVLVVGTNGIVVSAGTKDVVVLRGILINGLGLGLTGVRFLAGAELHFEGCVISGFSQNGIDASSGGRLYVRDTIVRAVGGSAIALDGATVATIERSNLSNGNVGIAAAGTSKATVHDSVISGFTAAGIHASATAEVNVDHGLISNNAVGVQADSTVRLSEVMISDNTTGVAGSVTSFGNNRIAAGNGTDGTPATTVPQQ